MNLQGSALIDEAMVERAAQALYEASDEELGLESPQPGDEPWADLGDGGRAPYRRIARAMLAAALVLSTTTPEGS